MPCIRWKKKLLIAVRERTGVQLSKGGKVCFGILAFFVFLPLAAIILYLVITWHSTEKRGADEDSWVISQLYQSSDSELGIYDNASISTDAPPCAEIGRNMLQIGGSAVDSAIATLLCMGIVNCHSMGLGGGFLMTIYNRQTQRAEVLDAREVAPKNAKKDMFRKNPENAQIGGLAIAVPGELMGYDIAHTKYGKLKWEELFTPTIELCKNGFPVGKHLAAALHTWRETIFNESSLSDILVNKETNDVYKEGEIMKRLDLVAILENVSKADADVLYGPGKTRENFIQDIRNFGGIITESDLRDYAPYWRKATSIKLKNNFTVYSVPPPGSGALLSFMLNVLDGYNLTTETNWNSLDKISLTLHRLIETFKFAYAKRMQLEDNINDPVVTQVFENMLDKDYANIIRRKIYDSKVATDLRYYGLKGYMKEDHGTAHLSVVAPNGDSVSVTSTINLYFGCKRRSQSTGIILNNEMDDFSSPDIINYFNIPPTERNQIEPGRRPMSSMTPTIIVDDKGDPWLVIGGNGGTQITSGIALVAMQLLWLNKSIKEAIDMPRLHHQLIPNHISYEKNFPKPILEKLKSFGHSIEEITGRMSIIMAVLRGEDGKLYANADYRKGGKTDGF